ncbi:hypothetical protein P7K49_002389, partial [Saguinus oedipus]
MDLAVTFLNEIPYKGPSWIGTAQRSRSLQTWGSYHRGMAPVILQPRKGHIEAVSLGWWQLRLTTTVPAPPSEQVAFPPGLGQVGWTGWHGQSQLRLPRLDSETLHTGPPVDKPGGSCPIWSVAG